MPYYSGFITKSNAPEVFSGALLLKLFLRFEDEVDELVGDVDRLDDLHALHIARDLLIRESRSGNDLHRAVRRDNNGAAELAVDLHGDGLFGIDHFRLVVLRPLSLARKALKALDLPKLLADMRRKRREKLQQHAEKISDIKGVQLKIEWGSQIRSYVFMPYQLVKDTRTDYETGNIQSVMDGDLDGFINAYLTKSANGELKK